MAESCFVVCPTFARASVLSAPRPTTRGSTPDHMTDDDGAVTNPPPDVAGGGSPEGFVPVGTPIDLDNCAREPIHIPGSIQPRGVVAVVDEPDFTVRQVSANT